MPDLTELGWDDTFAEQFETHARAGLVPGRVAVQHRGAHDVLTELGELRCDVAGRLYEESASGADLRDRLRHPAHDEEDGQGDAEAVVVPPRAGSRHVCSHRPAARPEGWIRA